MRFVTLGERPGAADHTLRRSNGRATAFRQLGTPGDRLAPAELIPGRGHSIPCTVQHPQFAGMNRIGRIDPRGTTLRPERARRTSDATGAILPIQFIPTSSVIWKLLTTPGSPNAIYSPAHSTRAHPSKQRDLEISYDTRSTQKGIYSPTIQRELIPANSAIWKLLTTPGEPSDLHPPERPAFIIKSGPDTTPIKSQPGSPPQTESPTSSSHPEFPPSRSSPGRLTSRPSPARRTHPPHGWSHRGADRLP